MEMLGMWVQRFMRFEPLLAAGVMVGIVIAGLLWLRAQREEEEQERTGAQSLRESLDAAYRAGEIDEREYQRVRDRLSEAGRKGRGKTKGLERVPDPTMLEVHDPGHGDTQAGTAGGEAQ